MGITPAGRRKLAAAMLSSREFLEHFSHVPGHLLDIASEVRNLVVQIAPQATEVLRHNGAVYFEAARGGPVKAGICQIRILPDHIQVAFAHGAFLPDPKRLLVGTQLAMRHLPIYDYDHAPWDDLQSLIEASHRFDPCSLVRG